MARRESTGISVDIPSICMCCAEVMLEIAYCTRSKTLLAQTASARCWRHRSVVATRVRQVQAHGVIAHGSGCETVVTTVLWRGACYPRYTVYSVFRYIRQEPLVYHRQMGAVLGSRHGLSKMDEFHWALRQSLRPRLR